jgi:hypothetical protein
MARQSFTVPILALTLFVSWRAYSAHFPSRVVEAKQDQARVTSGEFNVPRIRRPHALDCGANDWEAGRTTLSKETGLLTRLDVSDALSTVPPEVAAKLNSYQADYSLEWDEKNLYGHVQVREPAVDNRYPDFAVNRFFDRVAGGFFPDVLYDSVHLLMQDSTSQSARYTTEMQLYVRAPGARAPQSTFFGRTVDEEDFHQLAGKAIACSRAGGYDVTFEVAWLPSTYWQPRAGARGSIRLLAPLPVVESLSMQERSTKPYILARLLDITLEP